MANVTCILSTFCVRAMLSHDLDCIEDGYYPDAILLCSRYRKYEESTHYKFWIDFYENGEGLFIDRSATISRIETSLENLKMILRRDGEGLSSLLLKNVSLKRLTEYYGEELATQLTCRAPRIFQIPNGKRSLPTRPSIAIDILDVRLTDIDELFHPDAFPL